MDLFSLNSEDNLFVRNSSGIWYTALFPATIGNKLVIPMLKSPKNGTIISDKSTVLEWINYYEYTNYWYNIQISTDLLFKSDLILDYKWYKDPFFKVSDLKQNSKYYWRVRTHDIFASSEWSEIWGFYLK